MWGGEITRRSKEGSSKGKHRVIDVKLGKTQSLKPFNTLCGAPKACRCDLGICSQKRAGEGKEMKLDWSVSPPVFHFNSSSYPNCLYDTLMDVLTHPHPFPLSKHDPPPHLVVHWQVC